MPMLETNRLSVRYGTKTIVDSLSFSVSEGQWLMIVGPNGAGNPLRSPPLRRAHHIPAASCLKDRM